MLRLLAPAAVLLTACGHGDGPSPAAAPPPAQGSVLTVNEADNGKGVRLRQGQQLVVQLDCNTSTGYGWSLRKTDPAILHETTKPSYRRRSGAPGAGGTETLNFTAHDPGRTTLDLAYTRPWETDAAPARSYTLAVTVD